jgi:hypothetical protein
VSLETGAARLLLGWIAGAALLVGCRSVPPAYPPLPSTSSLLAVDVLFPAPLNRDPSLVQAWFLKGPVRGDAGELPELIPATFVKFSRAYLVDPEPGVYSVAAVAAEFAPPMNDQPVDGVSQTTASGISSDAMIFPSDLIRRTSTTMAPGEVGFAGLLQVRRGDHISADAVPADPLQRQIAERIRPGVTAQTGIRAWLARARVVDLANTSVHGAPADREAFLSAAQSDLGESPWAAVVARKATPGQRPVARSAAPAPAAPAPSLKAPARAEAPAPSEAAVTPMPLSREPESAAPSEPERAEPGQAPSPLQISAEPVLTPIPEPEPPLGPSPFLPSSAEAAPAPVTTVAAAAPPAPAPPPAPERRRFTGIPAESPLASIEAGMKHDEVLRILGNPDERIDRLTASAWIPFHEGPTDNLRDWIYRGRGRVVFSLYQGSLEVVDVVYDPEQRTSWGAR